MKPPFLFVALLLLTGLWTYAAAPAAGTPRTLSLPECLQIAVDHNPDLAIASTRFLDAQGHVIKLHAILYPTLNAQALSTPLTFYVQFQQIVYSRATLPQLRLGRLTTDQAFINYRQTLNDVVYQVRQAFITAIGARRKADLLRAFADRQVAELSTAQQFFDAGKLEKSALLGIQVKGNLAVQSRDAAELQYTQVWLVLDTLLGEPLPETTRLTGDLPAQVPPKLDLDELTATALRDRQDLKMLESLQLSATQQIEIDRKDAFPTVGISSDSAIQPLAFGPTGAFDLERNDNEPEIQRQEGDTQLPLSLYENWRIYDGGKLNGVEMSDRAKIASRDVALAELRQSIPGEIAGTVAAILRARDTLKILDAQISPEDLRHSADLDFEAGRIRELDKVNIEGDILQHQELHLDAEVRLCLAVAALDHALGRGLETSSVMSGP